VAFERIATDWFALAAQVEWLERRRDPDPTSRQKKVNQRVKCVLMVECRLPGAELKLLHSVEMAPNRPPDRNAGEE